MAIRQAVLVLCVRSRAAPALGTWMRSSPEIPPLFIKKVNPRWLISVFLRSSHSVLLHLYSLLKDPRCPSAQNHLCSAPPLLRSQFAFPAPFVQLQSVMGSRGGGMEGWHPGNQVWSNGASFPALQREQGPMAVHGLSAAHKSRDAGNEAQERVRSRPRLPTSFLSVHLVNNACRRLFIFV